MKRLQTWLLWACCLLGYILLGHLLGFDVAMLQRDLFPLLFGAAVVLVLHGREDDR